MQIINGHEVENVVPCEQLAVVEAYKKDCQEADELGLDVTLSLCDYCNKCCKPKVEWVDNPDFDLGFY